MDLVQKPEKRPKLALDFEIFQIFCLHLKEEAKRDFQYNFQLESSKTERKIAFLSSFSYQDLSVAHRELPTRIEN